MSHADEGTLHAYLDGELTAVERAGLEAHLEACAACRTRLAEERDLVERAQGLLRRAAPPEVAVPPLRRTGGGGRGARPLPRWMPLAWAASVLLALGGGWIARGGGTAAPAVPAAPVLQDAAPPAAVALGEQDAVAPAGPAAPAASRRDAPAAKTTGREEREAAGGAGGPTPPPTADQAGRLAAVPPPVAQAGAPRAEAVGLVASAVANADESLALTPLTVDSARAILGTAPVTIPGLPVRRIALGGPGVVVVEQALDATTVVRLHERRADAVREVGPDAMARQRAAPEPTRPAESSERLARYVGTLRVEIAGPVGADSLSKLLERVR
ncbi:MAG TPA: zf-HC2 domain-containing protein [Gemmatimonadales bacterium]|nr:zf-HC2 domain-containing protein [Gemmatimonadales bacterium]